MRAWQQRPPSLRLFISHKSSRADNRYAKCIGRLAAAVSLPYWLEIHDPVLTRVNGQPFTGQQQGVLSGATIKIALLNCAGVIVVHSNLSAKSKWIPFEFGRAKTHVLVSRYAAGYSDQTVRSTVAAEYLELAVKTFGEHSGPLCTPARAWMPVTQWLTDMETRWGFAHSTVSFPAPGPGGPPKLP